MYRFIYFLVVRVLLPVLHPFNDKVARGYKLRLPQNGVLPWLAPPKSQHPLWIHCASGEFEYALPVIREIKKKTPEQKILVTYFTPSYVERMKNEPLVDYVVPAPWDEPTTIQEFLAHHKPKALLFSRTDVWFEMSRQCALQKIPVVIFSMTFQKKINLMLQTFLRWRWQFVNQFWVVSQADADQLQKLLPNANISVVGDSRYDQCLHRLSLNKALPFSILPSTQKMIVAGSTWSEDEKVLIPTIAQTKNLRWVLVPHEVTQSHLQDLEHNLHSQNLSFVRSSQISSWDGTKVLIVDQMGILAELYRLTDMSFVGGSFRKQVHSVMESLACGCLTFVGPYYHNNREAMEFSQHPHRAVQVVTNSGDLTMGLLRFTTEWTSTHCEQLKKQFLQKTGSSNVIANKILNL